MTPPVFPVVSADSSVAALFGASPCRIFPFGAAPQGAILPYCVWRVVGGAPENFLGQVPDADTFQVVFDIYADTPGDALEGAVALRDAVEPVAYVTGWLGEWREPDTRSYRAAFAVDWIVRR